MAGHIPDSLSVEWCTQDDIVEGVHETFGGPPDLDPCSNPNSTVNAKTSFMLPKNDGLIDSWAPYGTRYVNPPFGKGWYIESKHDLDCPLTKNPNFLFACVCRPVREYIWPKDREHAKRTMSVQDFKAWIKPQVLVSIADWIRLCNKTSIFAATTVGLIPAYPGVKVWHSDVWKHARAIFFPEGRLHFKLFAEGELISSGPAPMDCAMPFWGNGNMRLVRFEKYFSKMGHVQILR